VTGVPEATSRFVESFKTRHATHEVLEALSRMRPLKILVIGEAIVDEYSYCTPIGKGAERSHHFREAHPARTPRRRRLGVRKSRGRVL